MLFLMPFGKVTAKVVVSMTGADIPKVCALGTQSGWHSTEI